MYTTWKGLKNRVESIFGSCNLFKIWAYNCLLNSWKSVKIAWNDQNCLRIPTFGRQLWAQILNKLHEPKMDSTLFFNLFQVVYMNFATKNLLACLCSALFKITVERISMLFPDLVNFYLKIQNPINLISIPTTYLESFGSDLSENEPFQCVSILLTGTSGNVLA